MSTLTNTDFVDRTIVYDWRNEQRLKLVEQFEGSIPELYDDIHKAIEGMGIKEAMQKKRFHDTEIAPKVQNWLEEQTEIFEKRLAKSIETTSKKLTSQPDEYSWSWAEIAGAGAVVAVSAAPVAAVPILVSVATVTSTSLFVFTSSAVSLPILGIGVAGLGIATLGGHKIREKAADKFRELYQKQIIEKINQQALGDPQDNRKDSLCGELLQKIDDIAKTELEQLK